MPSMLKVNQAPVTIKDPVPSLGGRFPSVVEIWLKVVLIMDVRHARNDKFRA